MRKSLKTKIYSLSFSGLSFNGQYLVNSSRNRNRHDEQFHFSSVVFLFIIIISRIDLLLKDE